MRLRLRLRGVLLLGTLVPLLIIAAVAVVVTQALTASLANTDSNAKTQQILYSADNVTKDVIDAETGMRGFVITGQEPFLEPYLRATAAFGADIDALTAVLDDPTALTEGQRIRTGFADWNEKVAKPVIAAVRSGARNHATQIVASGDGKARIDAIRADLVALTDSERATAADRLEVQRGSTLTVRRIAFWGTLATILLAVILAIVFSRRVSRRVRALSTAAAALAAGNLAVRAPAAGADEIADLGNAFNEMASKLEASAEAERQAADELRRRTAETETANRELEAFSYSVSHDLRAPLRSIDGFSQALMEDYGNRLDDTARDYITRVRAASIRMAALIDDLLRLSRLSRESMTEEQVDISALAADVVENFRASDPARAVTVTIQPGMRTVGDTRLIRIALENLIGNAWKFTGERPDPRVEIREEPVPDGREFVVADNGAGFDTRFAANLFGPFQRMHSVERFPGTGIGLATVQRIVLRHGGSIRAESEIGQGARFRFTFRPAAGDADTDAANRSGTAKADDGAIGRAPIRGAGIRGAGIGGAAIGGAAIGGAAAAGGSTPRTDPTAVSGGQAWAGMTEPPTSTPIERTADLDRPNEGGPVGA